MALLGINLKEVQEFQNEINKVREKLKKDEAYRRGVINLDNNYKKIKKYIHNFCKFLEYKNILDVSNFYRVRKLKNEEPFYSRKELIYPEPDKKHEDRMNNTNFRVLYVSLNEYTAMAETRLNKEYINKYFQLTKFTSKKSLYAYKLGIFSEIYFNTPRDSKYTKKYIEDLFGEENIPDRTIQGLAALECAIADILYDTNDGYHILSSIIAEVIFMLDSKIDAIIYPSMQNRYGINLAIKQETVDDYLEIEYTTSNKLIEVFPNGFFKYFTKKDSLKCDDENNLKFEDVEGNCTYR